MDRVCLGLTVNTGWRWRWIGLLGWNLTLLCGFGWCQEELPVDSARPVPLVSGPAEDTVDPTWLQNQLSQIQTAKELDEATRTSAIQLYQTALKRLEGRDAAAKKIAEYDQAIQTAPQQILASREERQQLAASKPTVPFGTPSPQLEQQRLKLVSEADTQRKLVDQLTDEPTRRRTRIAELPQLLVQLQSQLAEINTQLATPAPVGEHPELTKARRAQLVAHRLLQEREIERLHKEQLAYAATADLLPEQTSLARQKLDQIQSLLEAIQRTIDQQQESVAQRLLRESQQAAAQAPPLLHDLAAANVQLAESYRDLLESNSLHLSRLKELRTTAEEVDRQYRAGLDRIKAVGLTDALGVMFKQQRRQLDELLIKNRPDPQLKLEVRRLQVMSFELQDKLDLWTDDDRAFEQASKQLPGPGLGSGIESAETQMALRSLIRQRRVLTQEMSQVNHQAFQNLVALDTEQHQLVGKIAEFSRYIDQHVIWIPSAPVFARGDWGQVMEGAWWLASPVSWAEVLREPWRDLLQFPLIYGPLTLSLAFLFAFHRRLKRIISETGEQARRGSCAVIHPTLNSLLATVLMALLWPMALAVLGWMLSVTSDKNEFVQAVGAAALAAALFVAPLELLRHVCRHQGLADAHFNWSERVRKFFGQNVKVFYILAAPLLIVVVMMDHQENEGWSHSVGRLAAVALFVLVAYFLHLTLRSKGVIFQQMSIRNAHTQAYKLRQIWYLMIVGIPVFLLVAAMSGYYYTALKLGACLQNSVTLTISVIVLGSVLLRWLLVRRRSLSIEESRKLRQAQLANSALYEQAIGGPANSEGAGLGVTEQPIVDLASVSRQAKEIVVFSLGAFTVIMLWWIWRDILPAFEMLDHVVLWTISIGERVESVSLKSAFFALLVFGITFLFVKNMSGVINLVFLEYSSLDAGARYAATTIFRYLFIVVGAIVALSFLHIPWSQYGWLVAAVTVGLGFGLQEIVANFVSGLILLFERPVRVGDVVTIDGTTGVVTRIQMRATTVTNWDHQELIVPNKEFITGKLLNWTLSNLINRLVLNVGVAYGSDTDRVREILTQAITAHPDVLKDPAPMVNFDGFGESALNFVIRCYLGTIDKRVQAKHELNTAIHQALAASGISIPFPQREIHLVQPGSAGGVRAR